MVTEDDIAPELTVAQGVMRRAGVRPHIVDTFLATLEDTPAVDRSPDWWEEQARDLAVMSGFPRHQCREMLTRARRELAL